MALQTSGAISLSDIRGEFGGSAPDSLSEYYRGGGLVPDTPANAGIPTSGAISLSDFYGAEAQQVNFIGGAMSASDSDASAFSAYVIDSDGNEYEDDNGTLSAFNQWLLSGAAADWEVRMTMVSGTNFNGAALGVWLNCGTTRLWSLTDTMIAGGPVVGSATLEWGEAGTSTALGSVSVSISANRTS